MSQKVNPHLFRELTHYGLRPEAMQCYSCGGCTGTCPLTEGENAFPRKLMRYAQLGLEDKIASSPEPWLCYYCGECSDQCPREADPGETMMAMRRYLTAKYDWTGIARRFYTSKSFEVSAVLLVAALVGLAFSLFHGPMVAERTALNTFAPNWVIELADWAMAAVLSAVLLSNAYRCFSLVMGDMKTKIPLSFYLSRARGLLIHGLTQKQFSQCDDKKPWVTHLLIMTGYSSVFLMVVVFLRWFQRDAVIDPQWPVASVIMTLVGYYATFAIMYGTTVAIIGRIKKSRRAYRYSHSTDWMFLILLQFTTLTGIMIHFGIMLQWPLFTYWIFAIHLMVAVPMLVLEVPFAKWAHLAYRPLVLYLTDVKQAYREAA